MPNNTANYQLIKPIPSEPYDIDVHNSNMDTIDAAIKACRDHGEKDIFAESGVHGIRYQNGALQVCSDDEWNEAATTRAYVDTEMAKVLLLSDYDPGKTGTVNSARAVFPVRITASTSNPKLLSDITEEGEYICRTTGEANGFTDKPISADGFRLSVNYVRLDKSFAGSGANDPVLRQEFRGYSSSAQKCSYYIRYLKWDSTASGWIVGSWNSAAEEAGVLPLTRLGYGLGQVPTVASGYSLGLPKYLDLHNEIKEASVSMPYTARLYAFTDGSLIVYLTDDSTAAHNSPGYFRFFPDGRFCYKATAASAFSYFYGDSHKPYVVGYYTGNDSGSGTTSQQLNIGFTPSAVIVDGDLCIKSGSYSGGNGINIGTNGFTVSDDKNGQYPNPHYYIAFR